MDEKYFFQDLMEQLVFLEPSIERKEGLIGRLGASPIPIFQKDILKEVERQKETDILDYQIILKALLAIVSIDLEFPYWDTYMQFLKSLDKEIITYLDAKRVETFNNEEYRWSYIYAKAKYLLTQSVDDLFQLTIIMESIYNDRWKKKEDEKEELRYLSDLLKSIEEGYEKIISIKGDYSLAYERLAYIYVAKEQFVKARLYFEKALRGDSNEEDLERIRQGLLEIQNQALLEAAESFMVYNRFEEAIEQLNSIEERSFLPERINHHKGMSYYGLKRYDLAVEYLREAYRLDKNSFEIQNDLSVALAAYGEISEAIEVLSDSIDKNPESKELFYNRAILLYKNGQVQNAIDDFKKAYALEADPDLWNLIQNLEENI